MKIKNIFPILFLLLFIAGCTNQIQNEQETPAQNNTITKNKTLELDKWKITGSTNIFSPGLFEPFSVERYTADSKTDTISLNIRYNTADYIKSIEYYSEDGEKVNCMFVNDAKAKLDTVTADGCTGLPADENIETSFSIEYVEDGNRKMVEGYLRTRPQ